MGWRGVSICIFLAALVPASHQMSVPFNGCPSGFERHGNNCYMLVNEDKSQPRAAEACHEMGAFLAEPRSEEDNELIKEMVADKVESVFIGGTDSAAEGNWTWISNGDAMTFTDWSRTQPDNWNNEDCVHYVPAYDGWNDCDCYMRYPFLCQITLTGMVMPDETEPHGIVEEKDDENAIDETEPHGVDDEKDDENAIDETEPHGVDDEKDDENANDETEPHGVDDEKDDENAKDETEPLTDSDPERCQELMLLGKLNKRFCGKKQGKKMCALSCNKVMNGPLFDANPDKCQEKKDAGKFNRWYCKKEGRALCKLSCAELLSQPIKDKNPELCEEKANSGRINRFCKGRKGRRECKKTCAALKAA